MRGWQKCDTKCVRCRQRTNARLLVNADVCFGGINFVVDFLRKHDVLVICDSCYNVGKVGDNEVIRDDIDP